LSETLPIGLLAVRLLDAAHDARGGLIHVATNERRADQIGRLAAQLDPGLSVLVLPPWDCLPYDRASPSRAAMGRRVSALRALAARDPAAPLLLVTTADAVIQRLPPTAAVAAAALTLTVGDAFDRAGLEAFAARAGYVVDDRVDEAGEIALRGQVVEVFPAGGAEPVRLDVDGDRIAAVRRYDPVTQRTSGDLDRVVVEPASELIATGDQAPERYPGVEHRLPDHYPALATLFDYLPEACLSLGSKAEARRQAALRQVADAYEARRTLAGEAAGPRTPLSPDRLYLDADGWAAATAGRDLVALDREGGEAVPRFAAARDPLRALRRFAEAQFAAGRRLLLAAGSERDLRFLRRRVGEALRREAESVADWTGARAAEPGGLLALRLDLEAGFVADADAVAVVAAPDLIGARAAQGGSASTLAAVLAETGLHLGDAVVHEEHGLGVLEGLDRSEVGGHPRELVRLGYAGGSHRLVPTDELDKLWRYGGEADAVTLDRLDGGSWTKRRAEVEAAIAETARGLIGLAAERERATAPVLEPDPAAYERFAAGFAFAETPDQIAAIDAVLDDLRSGRPMDRLVVGDVGFGKTEVALRAAAVAALAGRQVAVVAPTTVLVRQHLQTFRRRFEGFGLEVAGLSRLVPPAEAKRVKAGLADGRVRIVVGTHALAAKGLRFDDLGLLVVDEEQRFGAAHKARLRGLAAGAHVLTLTATPIPRTLQSALVGLQQVSVLATPPTVRQPIRTRLTPFDEAAARTALRRERERDGQSFVVVPRIEDMEPMADRLRALVPELDLRQAHGRMPADEIDAAMVAFADGDGDVLLATNIIESGLDVPCANTMLVWRADRFGLSQLHQLRGRVGRGRAQGQVHLLTDPVQLPSEATRRRLATLVALDRLGAGFAVAARDLDLRGAGDLLGEAQAGHVKLIGVDLYQHLLGQALRRARGEAVDDWTPVLNLEAAGWLPDDYVPEPEVRLDLYARVARAADPAAVDALADEVEDRFGAPPPPVLDLLALARLRALARLAGVEKVDAGPAAIALSFHGDRAAAAAGLVDADGALRWKDERLVLAERSEPGPERLERVAGPLERLVP